MNNVNYDRIASEYDRRYFKNPHQGLLNTLRAILSQKNLYKVLEVGCGTCHWLKALGSKADATLLGIDSSIEMLKGADKPQGIILCQGRAEYLPLKPESFDFVFCINAIHHFVNKSAFIREGYRVLSKNGKMAIIGMDPRDDRNKWYIYEYFNGTYERDLARFPSWENVKNWFTQCGFEYIDLVDVETIHDPKLGKAVLKDPFLKKSACSQLILLSDSEYDQGMDKIKSSLSHNQSCRNLYENNIVLSMVIGKKSE